MSTVNDVIVSYGVTVKGIQETSRQKKNLKELVRRLSRRMLR